MMPTKDIRFSASLIISLPIAIGMLLGGVGTVLLVAYNKIHLPTLFGTAGILYVIGAMIGFGYGVALSFISREVQIKQYLEELLNGALYFVPAILIGWMVTELAAMLPVALLRGIPDGLIPTIVSMAAWIIVVVTWAFTSSVIWNAFVKIYRKII